MSATRLLDLRGVLIRVRSEGDGPPLLLLAGIGMNLEGWQPLQRLLPGRRLISFDAPGAGGSPPLARAPRMVELADLVAKLLDALDCPRADLLGFSFGGALAQQVARSHPSRVRRLVLAGTVPGAGAVQNPFALWRTFNPTRTGRPQDRRPHAVVGPLVGGVTRRDAAAYETYEDSRMANPPSRRGYRMQLASMNGWTSLPWLHAIRQPTLVLAGDDDPLVPVINSSIFVQLMPDCRRHVVRGGGHLFLIDQPESVADMIDRFLREDADSALGAAVGDTRSWRERMQLGWKRRLRI